MKDLPDPDWINHAGTFARSTHRRETLWDPHVARADETAFTDGWFVPTMPDLNQRHPLVATYLIQNAIWWAETAGVSGFRVDTLPYSDRGFLSQWRERLLEEYPGLSIVGEEWSVDPAIVSRWQQGPPPGPEPALAAPSLMDFPLQHALGPGPDRGRGPRERAPPHLPGARGRFPLRRPEPARRLRRQPRHEPHPHAARQKRRAHEDGFRLPRDRARHPGVHVWLRDPDAESGAQRGWPREAGFPRRLGRRFGRRHERRAAASARRASYLRRLLHGGAAKRGHGRRAHAVRAGAARTCISATTRQLVMVALNKTDTGAASTGRFAEMIRGNTTARDV